MFALAPVLLSALAVSTPLQEATPAPGLTLSEPASGVTLTLPEDWTFVKGDGLIMARSADESGFVLLAGAEENFAELREDVKALILERLDDVVVARSTAEGVGENGALEEIVTVLGQGTSKHDGAVVDFAGMLVQSGETGVLVLGAWKNEANGMLVADILESLHIRESAGEKGLEVTNGTTGASVLIPAGWDVLRNREGLFATCPHGSAMVVMMGWQDNFEESFEGVRSALLGWVFKDVKVGEFAVVEAAYNKSLGLVVAANGTAVDRGDDKPMTFTMLRIEVVDLNQGAVLFGAWKDEEHAQEVAALLQSLEIKAEQDSK